MTVAWKEDTFTGEANYDIDDDLVRTVQPGETGILPQFDTVKKKDLFNEELLKFLSDSPRTNVETYKFALEHGFLPMHAADKMRDLQKAGRLTSTLLEDNRPARQGAFYLNWNSHHGEIAKVRFEVRSET